MVLGGGDNFFGQRVQRGHRHDLILTPSTVNFRVGFVSRSLAQRGPTRGDRQWQALAVASPGRCRVCGAGLRRGLCPGAGDMSGRKDEPELDAGSRPRHDAGDQDQVLGRRLPGVQLATAAHAFGLRASGDHDPARSSTRGVAGRTCARADCGLRSRIGPACWCRRDHRAGRALDPASANAILRAQENPSRPLDDRGSDEPRSTATMAGGQTEGENATLRVRETARLPGLNSPPTSKCGRTSMQRPLTSQS